MERVDSGITEVTVDFATVVMSLTPFEKTSRGSDGKSVSTFKMLFPFLFKYETGFYQLPFLI